jgi:hypothetical protein
VELNPENKVKGSEVQPPVIAHGNVSMLSMISSGSGSSAK